MHTSKKYFCLFLFLFSLLFLAREVGAKEYTINISYSDGPTGIRCIDSSSLSESIIKSNIEKITCKTDEEDSVEITDDINIEKIDNQWVVSYVTTEKVLWIFPKKITIHQPIQFNELKKITIIYPDDNGVNLRIDTETVQKSDLSRLKIQATFNKGQTIDVTNNCKLELSSVKDELKATYELKNQTFESSLVLNINRLKELKVVRTGLISDYPVMSYADIRKNIKLYAVYSNGKECEISSDGYSLSTDTENGIITFTYKKKKTSTQYDKLSELKVEKTGLISDYPVMSNAEISKNVKLYAVYSNEQNVDITNNTTSYKIKVLAQEGCIQFEYGSKKATVEYDKLNSLEVKKTGIIANYPTPTEKEIKSNIKLYAVYSNNRKVDITDKVTLKTSTLDKTVSTSLTDNSINFTCGNKSISIELDQLSGITIESIDGSIIKISSYAKLNIDKIKAKIKVTACYSNGQQKDITNQISISSTESSIKYEDIEINTNGVIAKARTTSAILTIVLILFLLLATSSVILLLLKIKKNKTEFAKDKAKILFSGGNQAFSS